MEFDRTSNILEIREEFQYNTMTEAEMIEFDDLIDQIIFVDEQSDKWRQLSDDSTNPDEIKKYAIRLIQCGTEMVDIVDRMKNKFGYRLIEQKESTILLPLIRAYYDIDHLNLTDTFTSTLPKYCAKLEEKAMYIGVDIKKIFLELKEQADSTHDADETEEDRLYITLSLTQLTLEAEKTGVDITWLMQVRLDELSKESDGNELHYDSEDDPRL